MAFAADTHALARRSAFAGRCAYFDAAHGFRGRCACFGHGAQLSLQMRMLWRGAQLSRADAHALARRSAFAGRCACFGTALRAEGLRPFTPLAPRAHAPLRVTLRGNSVPSEPPLWLRPPSSLCQVDRGDQYLIERRLPPAWLASISLRQVGCADYLCAKGFPLSGAASR